MKIVLEYSRDFGKNWPLVEEQISILNTNHRSFVDLLDLTYPLFMMYCRKVINGRQMDSIFSKPTSHEKNNDFLGMLRKRRFHDYRQATVCIRDTKQSYIAQILECGGGMTKVHRRIYLFCCIYTSERLTLRN